MEVVTPSFIKGLIYHQIRSTLAKGFTRPTLNPLVQELEEFRLLYTGRLYIQLYKDGTQVAVMLNIITDCKEKIVVMRNMAAEGHDEAEALLYLAQMHLQEAAHAAQIIEELELGG